MWEKYRGVLQGLTELHCLISLKLLWKNKYKQQASMETETPVNKIYFVCVYKPDVRDASLKKMYLKMTQMVLKSQELW